MKVVLNVDRKYKKLVREVTFPIIQAQSILNEIEKKAQASQKVFPVELLLVDSSDEGIFRDSIVFGNQESKNIVFLVQRSLETTFSDLPNQEKEELLLLIEQELTKKEERPSENSLLDSKIEEMKPSKKQTKSKSEKKRSVKLNKKLIMGLISFVSLVVVAYAVVSFANTPESNKPTLQEYLTRKEFLKAGKDYPKEAKSIESELFELIRTEDKSYLDELKQFNTQYPTIQGNFDLAMFDYDYEKALSFYTKNSSEFEQDNERLALVGYAYLKTTKIDDAKKLLKKCNDAELEKLILQYEQAQKIINEKQKEIEELQKKPTENKEKIEQAIEELYQAKAKLNLI